MFSFSPHNALHAVYASAILSVCPFVYHTHGLWQSGWTYHQTFLPPESWPISLLFNINAATKFWRRGFHWPHWDSKHEYINPASGCGFSSCPGDGTCRRYGSSYSVCVPSLKFVGLPIRKTWRTSGLSISLPGDLDLWHWNCCALLPVWCATVLPILVFLRRFVLDLSAYIYQTCHRHMTLRPWPCTLGSHFLSLVWVFVLRLCTKFKACRPFHSNDIGRLLCEY